MKPIHVGVIVIVYLENVEQFAAICRRRNTFNMDGPNHTRKPQSFANGYQITVRGKPESEETVGETLARETLQEIGKAAAYDLLSTGWDNYPQLIHQEDRGDKEFYTFMAYRPERFLGLVKMDVSGLPELIYEAELLNLGITDRVAHVKGVPEDGIRRFFSDELKSLFLAFELAKKAEFANIKRHFRRKLIFSEFEISN